MAATNGTGNGRPKAITKEQREAFLALVREGKTRPQAAAELGLTGTRFRSLCNHDPAFSQAYEEARAEGRGNFRDQLRTDWITRAQTSDRLLWSLCITYLPECAWARRNQPVEAAKAEEYDFSHHTPEELDALCESLARAVADRSASGVPGG
jgi:hypothetical protein